MVAEQTPETGTESLSPEEQLKQKVAEQVGIFFPDYSEMDSTGFDNYDPQQDVNERGQVVRFYMPGEKTDASPRISLIYKKGAFVINYSHSPEPEKPYSIRATSNSIFKPDGTRWTPSEIDLGLENARIQMAGIDLDDPAFQQQLVGYDPEAEAFLTMQEVLDRKKAITMAAQDFRTKEKAAWAGSGVSMGWNLLQRFPDKAKELTMRRIAQRKPGKTEEPTSKADVVTREMNKIAATQQLLRNQNLL